MSVPYNQSRAADLNPPLQYLRVRDIVRPHGLLPISRACFYAWVAEGRMPRGLQMSPRVTVWSRQELLHALEAAANV